MCASLLSAFRVFCKSTAIGSHADKHFGPFPIQCLPSSFIRLRGVIISYLFLLCNLQAKDTHLLTDQSTRHRYTRNMVSFFNKRFYLSNNKATIFERLPTTVFSFGPKQTDQHLFSFHIRISRLFPTTISFGIYTKFIFRNYLRLFEPDKKLLIPQVLRSASSTY